MQADAGWQEQGAGTEVNKSVFGTRMIANYCYQINAAEMLHHKGTTPVVPAAAAG